MSVSVSVSVPVSVTVSEPARDLESGVRPPYRDQVNPVTVSDSVTVSVSVSVTGSDAPRAPPSHFHASTGGPWSMGQSPSSGAVAIELSMTR